MKLSYFDRLLFKAHLFSQFLTDCLSLFLLFSEELYLYDLWQCQYLCFLYFYTFIICDIANISATCISLFSPPL